MEAADVAGDGASGLLRGSAWSAAPWRRRRGRFSVPNWIRLPLLTRKTTRAPSIGMPSRTTSKSTNQTWSAGWPERPWFEHELDGLTPRSAATRGRKPRAIASMRRQVDLRLGLEEPPMSWLVSSLPRPGIQATPPPSAKPIWPVRWSIVAFHSPLAPRPEGRPAVLQAGGDERVGRRRAARSGPRLRASHARKRGRTGHRCRSASRPGPMAGTRDESAEDEEQRQTYRQRNEIWPS